MKTLFTTLFILIFFSGNLASATPAAIKDVLAQNASNALGSIEGLEQFECYLKQNSNKSLLLWGSYENDYLAFIDANEYQGIWSMDEAESSITYCPYDESLEQMNCAFKAKFFFDKALTIHSYENYQNSKKQYRCNLKN